MFSWLFVKYKGRRRAGQGINDRGKVGDVRGESRKVGDVRGKSGKVGDVRDISTFYQYLFDSCPV